MEDELYNNLLSLMMLSFSSSLSLAVGFIYYGIVNDYLLYPVYELIISLTSSMGLGAWVVSLTDSTLSIFAIFPSALDLIWFISMISYIGALFLSTYKMKRMGYYSAISTLVFGSMIFMFISGIGLTLSHWVWDDILLKLLPTLSISVPFFTYYLTNAGLINLIIFASLVIANVVDFDFSTYNMRKDKEQIANDEVL